MRWTIALLAAFFVAPPAQAAEKFVFGTNWKAEAEHGGFYQALAEGRYKKYGLDVTIRQGGPQVNHNQLLAAGVLDAAMISNNAEGLNFLKNDIPMVTVAAFFQKDPQVLLTHPGSPIRSIPEMKGRPIMISADARDTWWRYFELRFGFDESQIRRYTFNLAPFLVNKEAIQQGYVTSEPFMALREGVKANVFLIADTGWPAYSTMVTVSKELVARKPSVVQRFLNASIEGWYSYLYGDPGAGKSSHQEDESGDARRADRLWHRQDEGIRDRRLGRCPEARYRSHDGEKRLAAFFDAMVRSGLYPAKMDHLSAFDLRFVNNGTRDRKCAPAVTHSPARP